MSIRSLRFGRPGSSTAKARRRAAAEHVLEETFTGNPAQLDPGTAAELGPELAPMRSLVQTLEQLPGQAWAAELGPARTPSRSPSTAPRPGLRGVPARLRVAPGFGGPLAAAALAVAFFVGSLTHPFSTTATAPAIKPHPLGTSLLRPAAHVVLKPLAGAATHSLAVAYMPGGGHMLLNVRNLPRSAPGTYYELWLMTSDTDLVSVTSFRVGAAGTGSLKLVLPDNPSHYKYLDISLQHVSDGVTISQDNVLRGALPA